MSLVCVGSEGAQGKRASQPGGGGGAAHQRLVARAHAAGHHEHHVPERDDLRERAGPAAGGVRSAILRRVARHTTRATHSAAQRRASFWTASMRLSGRASFGIPAVGWAGSGAFRPGDRCLAAAGLVAALRFLAEAPSGEWKAPAGGESGLPSHGPPAPSGLRSSPLLPWCGEGDRRTAAQRFQGFLSAKRSVRRCRGTLGSGESKNAPPLPARGSSPVPSPASPPALSPRSAGAPAPGCLLGPGGTLTCRARRPRPPAPASCRAAALLPRLWLRRCLGWGCARGCAKRASA